jgi:shikimate kinase
VAKSRGWAFTDTDKTVSRKYGSITKLFEEIGEQEFRKLESAALVEALTNDGVVATGGGIVITESNRELLKNHFVIFLDSASKHVLPKINLDKRPLLKSNPAAWDELYSKRLPLYNEVARVTIFTGGKPVKTVLQELENAIPEELK